MDISSSPIQSYQTNQNIGNSARNAETSALSETDSSSELKNDEFVRISDQREIYEYLASEFPQLTSDPATVSRASQSLYEYQLLSFSDINTINAAIADADSSSQPLTQTLDAAMSESDSYSERKSLSHLKQVFSTLEAAGYR